MKNYRNGEHFLSEIYPNMQHEEIVNNHTTKSDTKEDKIGKYLKRLENAHDNTNEHKIKLLKELYYQKYIIKELPQSYIELQERIYKEQGYGNIKINENMKKELLKVVQKDQKVSLDLWIDYLISEDAMYPTWFKYYVFNGMITLGKYDKENNKFQKRDEKTVEKFLEINREVIANVYDAISKEIGKNEIPDEVKKALEQGESFKKLYLHFLRNNKKINYISNEGIWKKYKKGTDSKILCDSLQGKNTGWCTAGYETAKTQLEQGDFYVYYTKNEIGEYTNPRIAIRMEDDRIAEVRGIANNQNLEPEMNDIAEEKLNEFPDKEEYLKKVNDMKLLTKIDNKVKQGLELTAEELRFLYEIDEEILGFGYDKDSRIQDIKELRNIKKDLSIIFNCDEELIGVEYKDRLESGKYKVWYGNITTADINFSRSKVLLPEVVIGSVDLDFIKSLSGIVLPKEIYGSLYANYVLDAKGTILPQIIHRDLLMSKLKSVEGMTFSKIIKGMVNLSSVEHIENTKFSEYIGGNLLLNKLITIKNSVLPREIGGTVDMRYLEIIENVILSEKIGGSLILYNLKSINCPLPKEIGKSLFINNFYDEDDISNLILSEKIGGSLLFGSCICNLVLPESLRKTKLTTCGKIEYIPNEEYYNRNTKKR